LVETKAGIRIWGIETKAGAAETFRTIRVVKTVETKAKVILAIGIVGIVRTIRIAEKVGAGIGIGVALGIEAFYARLNKNSR
jgi:hypothetical protein